MLPFALLTICHCCTLCIILHASGLGQAAHGDAYSDNPLAGMATNESEVCTHRHPGLESWVLAQPLHCLTPLNAATHSIVAGTEVIGNLDCLVSTHLGTTTAAAAACSTAVPTNTFLPILLIWHALLKSQINSVICKMSPTCWSCMLPTSLTVVLLTPPVASSPPVLPPHRVLPPSPCQGQLQTPCLTWQHQQLPACFRHEALQGEGHPQMTLHLHKEAQRLGFRVQD